jgi:hypothetical protein
MSIDKLLKHAEKMEIKYAQRSSNAPSPLASELAACDKFYTQLEAGASGFKLLSHAEVKQYLQSAPQQMPSDIDGRIDQTAAWWRGLVGLLPR